MLVDADGTPLNVILTAANRNDTAQLMPLLDGMPPIGLADRHVVHSRQGQPDRCLAAATPDRPGDRRLPALRRPTTTRREVFVRHRPPVNAAADLDIVRNAVRYAAQRCGLQARIRGTHIFRRTAACRMVQAGTPFKEIADLLRHRCLDTMAIYAKVDLPALRRVTLPWPGRRP